MQRSNAPSQKALNKQLAALEDHDEKSQVEKDSVETN